MKKIVGEKNYFRIRVGYYRIGFEVRSDKIVLMRVLHRKDIYRYFPWACGLVSNNHLAAAAYGTLIGCPRRIILHHLDPE